MNKKILADEKIKRLREMFVNELEQYDGVEPIKFDIEPNLLQSIIFKQITVPNNMPILPKKKKKVFALPDKCLEKIDFDNVSFDGFDSCEVDYSKLHNVKINPQKIYNKNLSFCDFASVQFKGSFNDTVIKGSSFKKSKGAVIDLTKLRKNGYISLKQTHLTDAVVIFPKYYDYLNYNLNKCVYNGELLEECFQRELNNNVMNDEEYYRNTKALEETFKKIKRRG